MKLIKYMGMTLAVSTFASCTSDDGVLSTWESDSDAVHIQAAIGNRLLARSNPIGPDVSQFKEGDKLSLQADGQGPYTYTLTKGIWTPSNDNYLTWKTTSMNVSAYTILSGASQSSFTLPTDQSDLTKIGTADYMTFSGTCVRPDGASDITMELKRQTARIDITINETTSNIDGQSITDFTIAGNSVIKDGESSTPAQFIPYIQTGTQKPTYSVLVASNATQKDNETFVSLKVNGTPLKVTGIPVAEKGKNYIYQLSISEKAVSLSTISVNDWTTGDIINGGEIGSNPIKVDETHHTIIAKQEGQLTSELIKQATSTDGELIIIGPLNNSDLQTVGQETQSGITCLDLSKAEIAEIPSEAFRDSKDLTQLSLPATVTSIGNGFISGCNKLTSLTIMSSMKTLKEVSPSAFTGFTNAENCDLRLDSSRNAQIKKNAKKVFAKQTWKSIVDLNGSEFKGTSGGGTIEGEGADYPVEM